MRALVLIIVLLVASPAFGQQPKAITNSIGMKLVLIHAGSFTMGSPESEENRIDDEAKHEVTISKSYYLGACEVSQEHFEKVIGNNPSKFKGEKNPVEHLSWEVANLFCNKLSALPEETEARRKYRLPTEAEWEYACRATSGAAYSFGDSSESLGEYAWFGEGLIAGPHHVGEKKPNRWGLYDMHGNVWEWCQDVYKRIPSDVETDPQGPVEGSRRVFRGGSFKHDAVYCRSACRMKEYPSYRYDYIGFRVAMSLPPKQPESAFSK